jgi:hypothetical protein
VRDSQASTKKEQPRDISNIRKRETGRGIAYPPRRSAEVQGVRCCIASAWTYEWHDFAICGNLQFLYGHCPYMEIRRPLLRQTTIKTARNRAREGTPGADSKCGESWSLGGVQTARKGRFVGVHRSPRGLTLSLLFLVEMPASD